MTDILPLLHAFHATGEITGSVVVPAYWRVAYLEVLIVATADARNVFDLHVVTEEQLDDLSWQVRDAMHTPREITDEPLPVIAARKARLEGIGGKALRCTFRGGQGSVFLSAVLTRER